MNRQELLEIAKPILFNTEMVSATLDRRKTVTRRVVKNISEYLTCNCGTNFNLDENGVFYCQKCAYPLMSDKEFLKTKYQKGDILYVRETGFIQSMKAFGKKVKMLFKADDALIEFDVSDEEYERLLKWSHITKWLSPYWLTKETARIFLKVTDVSVERLQDMNYFDYLKEGLLYKQFEKVLQADFIKLWNSTIKKSQLNLYGWDANPWVWVYEFERVVIN